MSMGRQKYLSFDDNFCVITLTDGLRVTPKKILKIGQFVLHCKILRGVMCVDVGMNGSAHLCVILT
jgi:hypothetical protein